MSNRVYNLFQRSVEAKMHVGEALAPKIDAASDLLVNALLEERKILACGNGASAAIAQIFTSFLLDCFEKERPGLPAVFLGANLPSTFTTGDYFNYQEIFSKQIRALGQEGDVLVALSSSGNTGNIIGALDSAHERQMQVITLTGGDGKFAEQLGVDDVEICAHVDSISLIHEIHLLTVFCFCDLIDHKLFGLE